MRAWIAGPTPTYTDLRARSRADLENNLNDGLAWGLASLFRAANGASVSEVGVRGRDPPGAWGAGQLFFVCLSDHASRKPLGAVADAYGAGEAIAPSRHPLLPPVGGRNGPDAIRWASDGGVTRKTIDDLLREARSRLDRLEPEEALAAQRAGALLIDTRSHDERTRDGVIPGALHIPRSVLEWRLDPDADPAFHNPCIEGVDQWLILVCAHGYSTSLAAATLQDLGFTRATDLVGGFSAWKDRGLPVQPAPQGGGGPPGMGPPDP